MGSHIEQLLRLVADYHNFCNDSSSKKITDDTNELSEDMLDLIAAASNLPVCENKEPSEWKKSIR